MADKTLLSLSSSPLSVSVFRSSFRRQYIEANVIQVYWPSSVSYLRSLSLKGSTFGEKNRYFGSQIANTEPMSVRTDIGMSANE